MFVILLQLDVTVALLSLATVPFLYLCLRYYMRTLVSRTERVKELESGLIQHLYEVFSAMRLVKSFAREPYEAQRYTSMGQKVMRARIAITWQESLFSAVVSTITILGTALVLIVGGNQVLRGSMTLGELTVVIAYLGAVYGPLSSIAHTTGQLQGALAGRAAGARDVRHAAGDRRCAGCHRRPTSVKGDIRFEHVGFAYPDGTAGPARHQLLGGARRDGRARRAHRRRQDDAGEPDPAILRRHRRPRARSTTSMSASTRSDRSATRSRS